VAPALKPAAFVRGDRRLESRRHVHPDHRSSIFSHGGCSGASEILPKRQDGLQDGVYRLTGDVELLPVSEHGRHQVHSEVIDQVQV
jgi:hypothetical protein